MLYRFRELVKAHLFSYSLNGRRRNEISDTNHLVYIIHSRSSFGWSPGLFYSFLVIDQLRSLSAKLQKYQNYPKHLWALLYEHILSFKNFPAFNFVPTTYLIEKEFNYQEFLSTWVCAHSFSWSGDVVVGAPRSLIGQSPSVGRPEYRLSLLLDRRNHSRSEYPFFLCYVSRFLVASFLKLHRSNRAPHLILSICFSCLFFNIHKRKKQRIKKSVLAASKIFRLFL